MSTRFAKQLVYGAFYVVLWVLVIWAARAIFFRSAPAVPVAATAAAQPIAVISVRQFAPSPGYVTFLAKIENPNTALAAQYFPFTFDQSFAGASFLYPSEVKYIALINQPIPAGDVVGTGAEPAVTAGAISSTTSSTLATILLSIPTLDIPTSTTMWVPTSTFGTLPMLVVQNVITNVSAPSRGKTGIALTTGELMNNDTAGFNNIFIIAVYKDANGNPIGASQTELDSIAPDQTENFVVSYPAIPGINPALTEVQAYAQR
jgi:hypothetical protein